MKITEIRIQQRKNLGSYEHLELGITVVPNEMESPTQAIEAAKELLDWELNKESRDTTYHQLTAEMAKLQAKNGTAAPSDHARIEKIQTWIHTYHEREERIALLT